LSALPPNRCASTTPAPTISTSVKDFMTLPFPTAVCSKHSAVAELLPLGPLAIVLLLANLSELRGGRLSTSETDWQETKTNFYQRIWATCKLSYFKTKQSPSSSSTLLLLAPQSITNLLPSTGPDTATLVTNF
jgi:hypothetical protein